MIGGSAASAMRELLPRIAFLRPLVEGARVLELGGLSRTQGRSAEWLTQVGAASVLSMDEDATKVAAARAAIPSAKIRFVQGGVEELPDEGFDLVWLHGLDGPTSVERLQALLDGKGGFLVLGLAEAELGGAAAYRALHERLAEIFPSVEVATQRPLAASVLSFGGEGALPLLADPTFEPPPEASAYLFVCGPRASGLGGQWIVPLPPEEGSEATAQALTRAEARAQALEAKLAEAEARIAALERREGEGWPDLDAGDRRVEELERRLRELREREEMARRRAEEAELRARELERRSESWQSSRAEMMASLRLSRFRAEQAQKNAEGVFDAVADRERELESWKQRALAAESRIDDRRKREG